jgi:hypothetical protein
MMLRAQPYAIGLSDYFTAGNSDQGDCLSRREFGHLLVSTGGGTIVDGARITRVGLGSQLLSENTCKVNFAEFPFHALG